MSNAGGKGDTTPFAKQVLFDNDKADNNFSGPNEANRKKRKKHYDNPASQDLTEIQRNQNLQDMERSLSLSNIDSKS